MAVAMHVGALVAQVAFCEDRLPQLLHHLRRGAGEEFENQRAEEHVDNASGLWVAVVGFSFVSLQGFAKGEGSRPERTHEPDDRQIKLEAILHTRTDELDDDAPPARERRGVHLCDARGGHRLALKAFEDGLDVRRAELRAHCRRYLGKRDDGRGALGERGFAIADEGLGRDHWRVRHNLGQLYERRAKSIKEDAEEGRKEQKRLTQNV